MNTKDFKIELNTKNKELDRFLNEEMIRLDQEKKQLYETKGMREFAQFEQGETKIALIPMTPKLNEKGQYGVRRVFRIAMGGKEYDWGINPRSPMYRELLKRLQDNMLEFTVIKIGEGKATRWSVK